MNIPQTSGGSGGWRVLQVLQLKSIKTKRNMQSKNELKKQKAHGHLRHSSNQNTYLHKAIIMIISLIDIGASVLEKFLYFVNVFLPFR